MKRLFWALLCFAVLLSLCSCENGTTNDSSSESGENSILGADAATMVERALAADEWPAMDYATEQAYVSALFSDKITLSDCEDYCLASNIISAQLYKILVLKPKADKAEELSAAMDEYYEYVRTEGAFYPDQQASAAGSVKGRTENGYIYIIVHPNGTLVADKMLSE